MKDIINPVYELNYDVRTMDEDEYLKQFMINQNLLNNLIKNFLNHMRLHLHYLDFTVYPDLDEVYQSRL